MSSADEFDRFIDIVTRVKDFGQEIAKIFDVEERKEDSPWQARPHLNDWTMTAPGVRLATTGEGADYMVKLYMDHGEERTKGPMTLEKALEHLSLPGAEVKLFHLEEMPDIPVETESPNGVKVTVEEDEPIVSPSVDPDEAPVAPPQEALEEYLERNPGLKLESGPVVVDRDPYTGKITNVQDVGSWTKEEGLQIEEVVQEEPPAQPEDLVNKAGLHYLITYQAEEQGQTWVETTKVGTKEEMQHFLVADLPNHATNIQLWHLTATNFIDPPNPERGVR